MPYVWIVCCVSVYLYHIVELCSSFSSYHDAQLTKKTKTNSESPAIQALAGFADNLYDS